MIRLRRDGLTWRTVDCDLVMLDLERSVYLASNRTAALLWDELASGTTREQLVATLVDATSVAPETAAADVDRFLDSLAALHLLES